MAKNCGFYWLVNGALAGSGYPGPCLEWLYTVKGIRAILSLQPLTPSDFQRAQKWGILVRTIAIPDFTAGSPEQRETALQAIDEFQAQNLPTLVHCQGGLGRTGMILALYLVKYKRMTPKSAISTIRKLRSGAIEENTGQLEVIFAAKNED
jgi:atypical dual specificity phosphatase